MSGIDSQINSLPAGAKLSNLDFPSMMNVVKEGASGKLSDCPQCISRTFGEALGGGDWSLLETSHLLIE